MSTPSDKVKNVKAALGNPRTRLVYIGGLVLIAVVMAVAWLVMARKSSKAEQELQSVVSAPPQMQSTGGIPQAATPEYDKLLLQSNAQTAQEALETGTSAVPVPRPGVEESEISIGPQPVAGATTGTGTQPPPETGTNAYSQQHGEQELQAHEQAVQRRMQAMQAQMEKLQGYWATQPHSSVRVAADAPAQQESAVGPATPAAAALAAPGTSSAAPPDIRMGDMLYAVLDTGINTDDPAGSLLIQATIHQPGPFKGARVIGQVETGSQYAKTVGVHFTKMSVPGEVEARTIDAWAVNPDTARPAIASDVNNHYLSRAASIFIGSFLAGYADGLLQGGQTERVIIDGNSTVVQRDAYTDEQLIQIGVGNVGKTAAQQFSQGANRKPTISVDAGVDLGVWFIQDVPPAQ